MSHKRKLNAHAKKDFQRAALATARKMGCTCHPDIKITYLGQGMVDTAVHHDDWCPIVNAPTAVLINPENFRRYHW